MRLDKQRGVAVITALLLCTLAVSIVASLFWQQQVQVRSMENQRLQLQTKWILRGALDWARLVLQTAGQQSASGVTTLNDVWNTPLAETRLDQYIERERVEGEVFDATLSGRVIDASSRYNLRHLADGPKPNLDHQGIYANLLRVLQIDPALAKRTADYFASTEPPLPIPGQTTPPAKSLPVAIKRVEDLLVIPGYTPEIIAKLRDFVIVLPFTTGTANKHGLNVNTAPPEVLAAVIGNFTLAEAQALVESRRQAYFRDMAGFTARLNGKVPLDPASLTVGSEFFLVQSRIRLDRANLDSEALVERQAASTTVLTIRQN
ncbi:type II secretion system minor pseudopilin GspK [Massilia sp. GCM10020059]|uniref:Type II secretion system protein K n=1 Tax=Massilia agrisoli TaxID=2892444 RepID=A0ABS8ITY6_9BURK|nr:type II secretion system minor pseudopilin GspK [Massilia agrisoli]MCC6070714.1 type II secretion system minor pseudopilin GspK [Massilia agrisoli]